jgi:c-di-GMP-related signal transduction protein
MRCQARSIRPESLSPAADENKQGGYKVDTARAVGPPHLQVIAQGVESQDQAERLQQTHDAGQGYYFGKPEPM